MKKMVHPGPGDVSASEEATRAFDAAPRSRGPTNVVDLVARVVGSGWYAILMGSLAITLALLDVLVMKLQGARTNAFGLADVSDSYSAIISAALPLLVVLVADTAVQRWLACRRAVCFCDKHLRRMDVYMDIAATLTYVAAIGGLASDSVSVQPGRYHLDEWKADEKRAAGIRLFLTDALLMSIMMRFVTVIYRYQCWRGTRLKRMEDRVSTSHSVRALLCWLGWACVAVIGCVQQAVVQIWAAYSFSMVSVVPSNALASLSRMPDEAARNSLVQGFIDSTDSATCLRVVHATCLTTGWQFPEAGPVGVPVEDSMVVTNGAHDVTLATSNCFMDDWNLFFKLIFTTAMLAGFAVINILGVSGVVAPLLGLLKHIIAAASSLDEEGMLVEVGSARPEGGDLSVEVAVQRVVRAIRLLWKASLRGKAVVRRMMQEAANDTNMNEHQMGVMAIFGGIMEGQSQGGVSQGASLFRVEGRSKSLAQTVGGSRLSVTSRLGMNSYSKARPTARSSLLPRQSGAKEGPEPQSSRRRAKPGSFAFDVLSMTQAELQSAVVEMFSQLGLVRKDTRDGRGRKPPRGDPHASIKSFAGENGGDGGLSDTPSGLMLGRASNGPDADSSAPRTGPKGVASLLSSNETKSSPRAVRSDLQRGDGSGRRVRMTEPDSFQEPVAGGMGVVRESVLVRFIEEVSRRYPDNPYHSWKHAVDVANTIFTLLHLGRPWVEMHLTRLDVFCLMVAAISHDVGHRGVSNGHLCKTDDILALTYNNRSVQEMMHAASLFQLTANIPEANVFEALPPSQLTEARSTIIDLILDTDMAQHFHRIGELEVLADTSLDEATGTFRQFTRDEVKQVMNAFLHIADLGHAFKPPRLHALWSARVLQEFFAEAEIQKELGIPPLPFMDPDKCFVPVAQMEYLDFVVRPYTAVLVRMLPSLKLLVEGIRDNYLFWLEAVRRSHRAVGIRASIDDAHARFATPGEAASGAGDSTKTSGDRDGEIAQRAPSRLGKMPGAPPRWGAEKGDAAEEEDSLEDVRQWVSQLGMKTLPMTAREIKVSATRTTFMGKLEPLLAMEMPRASQ